MKEIFCPILYIVIYILVYKNSGIYESTRRDLDRIGFFSDCGVGFCARNRSRITGSDRGVHHGFTGGFTIGAKVYGVIQDSDSGQRRRLGAGHSFCGPGPRGYWNGFTRDFPGREEAI